MAKWSNAAVCKTAIRGFDSHSSLKNTFLKKRGVFINTLFIHKLDKKLLLSCG